MRSASISELTRPDMPGDAASCLLLNARLPAWLLREGWPRVNGDVALAQIVVERGRVMQVQPMNAADASVASGAAIAGRAVEIHDLAGTLVLPAFVDAHVHLDKAFTFARIRASGPVKPGLMGAIEASLLDLPRWTPEDILARATRGMEWAFDAGTTHVRTHVNWADVHDVPLAWSVLNDIAHEWSERATLEMVSLTKLESFTEPDDAHAVATHVAATGSHAVLGGFVHSGNYNEAALRNLIVAAQECGLDVDLHVDEELEPAAQGLRATARLLRENAFDGRVVCGHVCALAAQDEHTALSTLDEVARAPITLISLPITNLLLQDATHGRTPRMRGITLVKEARARGIPLLFASDNVQDPFCHVGSFDPIESMASATLAAQLEMPFDDWSDTLCRADFLRRGVPHAPQLAGMRADFNFFPQAEATSWPSRAAARELMRAGRFVHHH